MEDLKKCPFDNFQCICQFCEEPCNNGLNCYECVTKGGIRHSVYICTGFVGNTVRYIENLKNKRVE